MTWNCPICGLDSPRVFRVRREYWVRGCQRCGHRFVEWSPDAEHVTRAFGDAYFTGGGAGYPDYCSEGAALRKRGTWYSQVLAQYLSPGTLLDVGSAAGFISDGFRSQGWHPEGLEPNRQMAGYGRNQLGLEVHCETLERFASERVYDLVSMVQVVQHFTDLRRAMKSAVDHIRPGGFCLVETWDSRSLSARCFGSRWHGYNPPTVLHYFSRGSLEHLCGQFGFQQIAAGRPPRHLTCEHAKSLLLHHLGSRRLVRMLDFLPKRLAIPYPGDDLFWMLFQKPGHRIGRNETVAKQLLHS